MKKSKMSSIIATLLLLGSGCTALQSVETDKNIVFYSEDFKGDDKGSGTYTYPTDKIYIEGAFDIEKFSIVESENYYDFIITIGAEFKNDRNYFSGWDIQMFDIYLQLDEGKHSMAIAGRNVKFGEKWDKAIMIAPERRNLLRREINSKNNEVGDSISTYEDIARDILIPDAYIIDYNTITARVSKENISLDNLRGVQVFSLGFNPDAPAGNTYNLVVERYTGQHNFGGGSNFPGNPNVIDILGSNEKLADYISQEGYIVYPTIDFIGVE